MYIELQNFFEVYFEVLKCTQTNQTIFVTQFIFVFAVLPKICFCKSTFQNFCSDLFCRNFQNFTNFCFSKNLLAAAGNRFKVLKIFISLKVRVCIQDHSLRSEKALDAQGFERKSTLIAKYKQNLAKQFTFTGDNIFTKSSILDVSRGSKCVVAL